MAYIDFILGKRVAGRKTEVWKVVSVQSSYELGIVGWHSHWRRYVFSHSRKPFLMLPVLLIYASS